MADDTALWRSAQGRALLMSRDVGPAIRLARRARGWRQADLAAACGYSTSTISRLETGRRPPADLDLVRRVAGAAGIPPRILGVLAGLVPLPPATVMTIATPDAEENDVRRRQLLANLALTAAGAITTQTADPPPAPAAGDSGLDDLLTSQVRDAMLGLAPGPSGVSPAELRAGLASALADFHHCRYARLAGKLPRLISAGHLLATDGGAAQASAVLAGIYTLTTRMLIKLDDNQLGWMAADRAKVLASGSGDPLLEAEAARNLAVLARKAGWHAQAASIALAAAASPRLRGADPRLAAERGLLIQSAAYTAARAGDRDGMRELTGQAAALAGRLGEHGGLLRDHGGGFSPATVGLHRISAENYAGDPGAAIAAATLIPPASLPTTERRARYWTDTARAYAHWGRREDCIRALLAAEHEAPQDIHTRPAVRDLIRSQLITGRTSRELRGLAQRCGIT
jgi:transcriptional regulator with XRE-family HTH domain